LYFLKFKLSPRRYKMSSISSVRQMLRRKTLNYYKRLMWVGKDWPDGIDVVRRRAKPQFLKGASAV
jgi:hypothetical protein